MTQERTPEGGTPTAEPFAVPEKISDDVWSELFADKEEVEEPAEEEDSQPEETPVEAEAGPSEESQPSPQEQAQQIANEMIPRITGEIAARMGQGQSQTQATKGAKESLIEDLVAQAGEGADVGSITQLVDTIARVAETYSAPRLQKVEQQLARLSAAQQRQQGDSVVRAFNDRIDALCDEAGITGAFERKSMRSVLMTEGLRQYGDKFDMAKVERLFRQENSARIREQHEEKSQRVAKKKEAVEAEPKQKTASGSAFGAESVRKILNNPREKGNGFRGKNFQKLANQYWDRALG